MTTIRNIDELIVLSFKNGDKKSTRIEPTIKSFTNYYIPLVDIKHFNALFDNKPFFDQPIKQKKCIKSWMKCREIMIIQHETYYSLE